MSKNEKGFPRYFSEQWKNKTGNDIVTIQKKRKTFTTVTYSCMGLVLVGMIAWTIEMFKAPVAAMLSLDMRFGIPVAVAMVLGIVSQSLAGRYSRLVNEFQRELDSVSNLLGRDRIGILSLGSEEMAAISVALLKGWADYLKKVDGIAGIGAPEMVGRIRDRFKDHYDKFVFWGIIADTGWNPYFKE